VQYAAHLPNTRSLLVPVLALTIGAAGATATYAVLDDTDVTQEPTKVIVAETTPPSDGVAAKDEARTAAAVAAPAVPTPSSGVAAKDEAGAAAAMAAPAIPTPSPGVAAKDEAGAAAAIGRQPDEQTPSEAAQLVLRRDPHGSYQPLPRALPQP
jgi:hypothetical protein